MADIISKPVIPERPLNIRVVVPPEGMVEPSGITIRTALAGAGAKQVRQMDIADLTAWCAGGALRTRADIEADVAAHYTGRLIPHGGFYALPAGGRCQSLLQARREWIDKEMEEFGPLMEHIARLDAGKLPGKTPLAKAINAAVILQAANAENALDSGGITLDGQAPQPPVRKIRSAKSGDEGPRPLAEDINAYNVACRKPGNVYRGAADMTNQVGDDIQKAQAEADAAGMPRPGESEPREDAGASGAPKDKGGGTVPGASAGAAAGAGAGASGAAAGASGASKDKGGGTVPGGDGAGVGDGGDILSVSAALINDIAIWRIAAVLKGMSKIALKGATRVEEDPVGEDHRTRDIRDIGEIGRALPGTWALPPVLRNARLANRSLPVRVPGHRTGSKQRILILIDVSSSMARLRRINIALGAVRNRLDAVIAGRATVRIATFNTSIVGQWPAETPDEARATWGRIRQISFRGGGTDIQAAALAGLSILEAMPGKRPEMVIVTDGDCQFDPVRLARVFEGSRTTCHVLQVDGNDTDALRFAALTGGAAIKHIRTWEKEPATYDASFQATAAKLLAAGREVGVA